MLSRFFNFIRRIFGRGQPAPVEQVPAPAPIEQAPPPEPVNIPETSNITIGDITGATNGEKQMIITAIGYLHQVFDSKEFKDAVLAAKFTNTNGLSNKQIYKLIMTTKMVVNVDYFYGNWKQNHVWHTMGYEDPNDDYVHANKYFITDAITMMSLIGHELMHEPLGFHHDSASEYSSVPYTMNAITESVAKQLGLGR